MRKTNPKTTMNIFERLVELDLN